MTPSLRKLLRLDHYHCVRNRDFRPGHLRSRQDAAQHERRRHFVGLFSILGLASISLLQTGCAVMREISDAMPHHSGPFYDGMPPGAPEGIPRKQSRWIAEQSMYESICSASALKERASHGRLFRLHGFSVVCEQSGMSYFCEVSGDYGPTQFRPDTARVPAGQVLHAILDDLDSRQVSTTTTARSGVVSFCTTASTPLPSFNVNIWSARRECPRSEGGRRPVCLDRFVSQVQS